MFFNKETIYRRKNWIKVSNKKNQYLRWTSNDYVRFKDRIIFTLKEDGIIYNYLSHVFTVLFMMEKNIIFLAVLYLVLTITIKYKKKWIITQM